MIQFLLKFLGVKIDGTQEVTSVSLQLRHSEWLGWIVFIALLLGAFSWWVHRYLGAHRSLLPRRRRILNALRTALLLLLLFMLLRPVFSFKLENRLRRALIMLVDKSGSMDIPDLRSEDADIKRAAIAAGHIEQLNQSPSARQINDVQHIPRVDLVKAAFSNSKLDLLNKLKKKYDLEYITFNRTSRIVGEEDILKPSSLDDDARQATALGDAVREVLNRKRGQPVAGMLLVTDGANNSGSEPLESANAAAKDKMPLYIYGVGITSPRDIAVDSVFTSEVAFVKDEVSVSVRVRAQGMKGQTAHLSLKMGEEEVASKDLNFSSDGEMAVPLTFTPQKAGDFDLTASIPPREDETVKDNNSASQRLRVIDSKIKVLFIEQVPRWEFRFAQGALLRDRRLDAKFLLFQADSQVSKATGSPYIEKLPATKDELFKYDLIIIGDVDPKSFTAEQMDNLNEFVSKFGGAITFIAGQQFDPAAYVNTPLGKILPVEPDTSAFVRESERSTTLVMTSQGRTSPMLRLSPNEEENMSIWQNFPPIHWISRVARAKPGAQVLLEDSDPAKMTRFGRMPAMALQQYGMGQSLFIGTDNTWRWRQEGGAAYHPIWWGQIVQRMALAHLLGGSKRTQLSSDKQRYNTSDRVTILARLYNQNFDPIKEPFVNASYTVSGSQGKPDSPRQSMQLRAIPDQPGMYRGDFIAASPGDYKFSVESDTQTVLEFSVIKSRYELGETAMNELLLKEMARVSGGAFFREENLAMLPEKLSQKDERITRIVDADLWASPFYFALLCALITTEWLLRKKYELK